MRKSFPYFYPLNISGVFQMVPQNAIMAVLWGYDTPEFNGILQRGNTPANSSPASATRKRKPHHSVWFFFFLFASAELALCSPGYEADERSSLGKRADRRRWREEGGERSAAVDKIEEKREPEDFIGHRKPGCRTDAESLPVRLTSSPASATMKTP